MSELAKRTVFGSLFVIVIIGSILLNYWAFFAVMLVTVIIGSQEVSRLVAKENDLGLKIITIIVALLFFVVFCVEHRYEKIYLCAYFSNNVFICTFVSSIVFKEIFI